MLPTWNAFPDYLAAEFPHLRQQIEDEALESPLYPHYFLQVYLLPELLGATRSRNVPAVSHASDVLEAVLGAADSDLAEAALHSVLRPIAESSECELLLPYLGGRASLLVRRLLVLPGG